MPSWHLLLRPIDNPVQSLATVFVTWKALLLLVAISSPGPGYDTSTTLYHGILSRDCPDRHFLPALLSLVSTKLTRWDAIYFTKVANRGYLYEQEWAFGWGLSKLIEFFSKDLREVGFDQYEFTESFVGIAIAHVSHGASVIALYSLGQALFPQESGRKVAFIAACLHIFSPAGLFLSAPYGESLFSFLAFLGCLCFVQSFRLDGLIKDCAVIVSGIFFGLATTARSNGLLYGILFMEEAFNLILFSVTNGFSLAIIRNLAATGLGGLLTAFGFLLPQYIAYQDLCATSPAPWCAKTFPSVYTYVQDHYWDCGFLRYWKTSNIPLFLLATPMLTIMTVSSFWALENPKKITTSTDVDKRLLRTLGIIQFLLVALALTNFHVQIITRISSGYPIWYFWLAAQLVNIKGNSKTASFHSLGGATSVVKYMVIYALVQGGLFASFLPPA